ncbi:HEXXH motif-containing putative peptide modification protein [Paraburkholderia sediminicola]|uniref:aKG-HExxH-type peptide beta-hydroxylase n=1 Tax=Paraburkholderia sediminicola TaxID=458836 RepID=UPI0038B7D8C7
MKTISETLNDYSEWRELALPRTGSSRALLIELQRKLKESLLKVLQEIERVIPDPLTQLRAMVWALDPSRRYAPDLYFAYFSLLESMARSDAVAVVQRCNALRDCLYAPYCDEFEIRQGVDDITLSFTRARHTAAESDVCRADFSTIAIEREGQTSGECPAVDPSVAQTARRHCAATKIFIAARDPDLADELDSIVSVVQLMPPSFAAEAASSLSSFGMVLVRPLEHASEQHQRLFYFDRLVHEASHLYLNLLMTFDQLVTNGSALAPSPARQTLRPVKGVLHAHFVFFRLLHAYRSASELAGDADEGGVPAESAAHLPIGALPLSFHMRQAAYAARFMQGDAILRSHAEFTERGRIFLESMREAVQHV